MTGGTKINEADHIRSLVDIQAKVIEMRRMADSTTDTRRRDAYLRVADAIENRARALDKNSDQETA